MDNKTVILLVGILLFHQSCQKEFYLDDLNTAETNYEELKEKLNKINSENRQLLSENRELNLEVSELLIQLDESNSQLSTIQERVNEIEEQIESLIEENKQAVASIESEITNLVNRIEADYPQERILLDRLDELLSSLTNSNINIEETNQRLNALESEFALRVGIQDGYYEDYRVAYTINIEDFENNKFELIYKTSFHFYYKIKNQQIEFISMVCDKNDPNNFDNPFSSEPFLNKTVSFYGTNSLHISGIDKLKVIYSYQTDEGEIFDLFFLRKIDSIPLNRTNQELQELFRKKKTGFFSDPIYSQIDVTDLSSFLEAFIEDGKRYGRDMSWINPSNYKLRFDDFSLYKNNPPNYQVEIIEQSCEEGGRTTKANFLINEQWWNKIYFADLQNLHIQHLWKIFGNYLFQYNIFQGEGHILSFGPSGNVSSMTFDNEIEIYNFQLAAKKMFQGVDQISWSLCNSKN